MSQNNNLAERAALAFVEAISDPEGAEGVFLGCDPDVAFSSPSFSRVGDDACEVRVLVGGQLISVRFSPVF